MTTIVFPAAVNALAIDPAERSIFVGTSASVINQFNLIQFQGGKYEAVGGDPSHPLQATESTQYEFRGHSTDVTALCLSFDGSLIISGDKFGEVFVWDIGSRQVLRKIKGQNGILIHGATDMRPNYQYSYILETRRPNRG
jgi:pre-rRNA-processing protein IPI3